MDQVSAATATTATIATTALVPLPPPLKHSPSKSRQLWGTSPTNLITFYIRYQPEVNLKIGAGQEDHAEEGVNVGRPVGELGLEACANKENPSKFS